MEEDDGHHVYFYGPDIRPVVDSLAVLLPDWRKEEVKNNEDDEATTTTVRLMLDMDNTQLIQSIQRVVRTVFSCDSYDVLTWGSNPIVTVENEKWTDENKKALDEACATNGWSYETSSQNEQRIFRFYDSNVYASYEKAQAHVPDDFVVRMKTFSDGYAMTVRNKLEMRVVSLDGELIFSECFAPGSGKHDVHVYDYPDNLLVVTPETMGGGFLAESNKKQSLRPFPQKYRRQVWCAGEKVVDVPGCHAYKQERRDVHITDEGDCVFWSFARDYACMTYHPPDDMAKEIQEFCAHVTIEKYGVQNIMCGVGVNDLLGVAARDPETGDLAYIYVRESERRNRIATVLLQDLFGSSEIRTAIPQDDDALAFLKAFGFMELNKKLVRPEI